MFGAHVYEWNKFFECFMKGNLCFGSWFNHTKEWLSFCQQYKDKILIITYEEMIVVRTTLWLIISMKFQPDSFFPFMLSCFLFYKGHAKIT